MLRAHVISQQGLNLKVKSKISAQPGASFPKQSLQTIKAAAPTRAALLKRTRSPKGGYIYLGSTPDLYKKHPKDAVSFVSNKVFKERLVFIKS